MASGTRVRAGLVNRQPCGKVTLMVVQPQAISARFVRHDKLPNIDWVLCNPGKYFFKSRWVYFKPPIQYIFILIIFFFLSIILWSKPQSIFQYFPFSIGLHFFNRFWCFIQNISYKHSSKSIKLIGQIIKYVTQVEILWLTFVQIFIF